MFRRSIGKRALPGTAGENKKIQEVANICIHGCFECGVLQGDYSAIKGPKLEKFYVSKYLLDKYFKFITQGIRKNFDTDVDEIIKFLKNNDMVIISQKSTNNEFSKLIEDACSSIRAGRYHKILNLIGGYTWTLATCGGCCTDGCSSKKTSPNTSKYLGKYFGIFWGILLGNMFGDIVWEIFGDIFV